ncbi:nicotinamide-nucleotide amidase [Herbihabitans rhizosphaerae]|uniref:Nicotinamide-nucleotide amidase n=1 Tax=Herbihabitans rhizosphaerae TaxID=1872711 RepID=A0A4Q7KHL7_9PSEU|nr:CinA family protein [Herbihabitans rhizosphaerae]RZS34772.1 nicotinamide-nucleotide amidase [Herbihabitans rhizosphaerae]
MSSLDTGIPEAALRRLVDALRERGETVAAAESLTAGLVCALLTTVSGSSAVLRGGLVVYATDLKAELAGVDRALLAEHGAVHPDVAGALATGARERCGADWGLGLTGVAGPDGQDGQPPGTVFVAVAGPNGAPATVRGEQIAGGRHEVRSAAARACFSLLAGQIGVPFE